MTGRKISHYELEEKLGEGAMGEVYRARDSRLNRDVAIKIIPERFASDSTVMSRFRREAQVMASVSHANIGQIYGIEEAGDSHALILELIEGPTLEDRIEEGPLPLEEALTTGMQVAAALEAAHERGIVHRDLKPANVKLTPGGEAKVLDFGLAKGMRLEGQETLTTAGMIVGTPRYMSPEQTNGRELDRRADIWAFGCLLYEMLSGRPAFTGEAIADLFVAIGTAAYDLEALADSPAPVRHLIQRCLRTDPRRRLRDIGDARVELEDALHGDRDEAAHPVLPREAAAGGWSRSRIAVVALVGLCLGLLAGFALFGGDGAAPESAAQVKRAPSRFSIAVPPTLHVNSRTGLAAPMAVSPDGRTFAFTCISEDGAQKLWVRRAGSPRAVSFEDTEGAENPFFSPDGESVGFFRDAEGSLERVSLSQGTVEHTADVRVVRGADWGPDDEIVFGEADKGIRRMPAWGGEITALTRPGPDERDHRWPQFLPDGRSVLFTALTRMGRYELRVVSLATGKVTALPVRGRIARYVPSGHLVFTRTSDVWAVRFDLDRLTTVGEPDRILSGVHVSERGNPFVAVSDAGVLIYEPARPPAPGRSLVWVDRSGESSELTAGEGYEFPRLSPNGRKIAVAIHKQNGSHEIWTIDADGLGGKSRVSRSGNRVQPTWSPEGDRLVYGTFGANLFVHRLGEPRGEQLLDRKEWQYPLSWVREDLLLFMESTPENGWDLLALDPTAGSVRTLSAEVHNEYSATLSPDGRRLAYVSDETGRNEVYLQAYPDGGGRALVSREGGTEPVWSPSGVELFYRSGRTLNSVAIPTDDGVAVAEPREVFSGDFVMGFCARPNYDVSADGERFVMVEGGWGLTTGRLDVFLDFSTELTRRLGGE